MSAGKAIDELLAVMAALRAPDRGCPWDLEQDFRSIAPYTIEEAYEVADAIERGDRDALKDELGDLLFQVVYHAQMAKEEGAFDFADVAAAISAKMKRRHPHVFGDAAIRTAAEQTESWESHKASERAKNSAGGLLGDVPAGLPGLTRAVKLQGRAARIGFDWKDARSVADKIGEESAELIAAMEDGDRGAVEEEFGDVLFALANLSRHLKVDPEAALRRANQKFRRRFSHIEKTLAAQNRNLSDASLDEMEALWSEAKERERS